MAWIIAIGASSGGIKSICQLLQAIPSEIPAAFFVCMHLSASGKSILPEILAKFSPLKITYPENHCRIEQGTLYVAPPNKHLVIEDGLALLSSGPRENRFRPSIDVLFRSAAQTHRSRVIGILLSGTLYDGVAGMVTIKKFDGTTIIQDPKEALYPELPANALKVVPIDYILSLREIASKLIELTQENSDLSDSISEVAEMRNTDLDSVGERTIITCPDCGGILWEINKDNMVYYQCHVGHRYFSSALFDAHNDKSESSLWNAMRHLRENAVLARNLKRRAIDAEEQSIFEQTAQRAEKELEELRRILLDRSKNRTAAAVEEEPV